MNYVLIACAVVLGIIIAGMNIVECGTVHSDGWGGRTWPMSNPLHHPKYFLFSIVTLPGAILGLLLGIITFRWIDWLKYR